MGIVKTAMKTAAICLAVGAPLAVTAFEVIGGPASVAGSSMQPSFNPGGSRVCDVVWVNRVPVASGSLQPTPGQVIVMRSPSDSRETMIKRVIAKNGQHIRSRSYRRRHLIVPRGHLWVEGDNRRTSRDSNLFGPVSEGLVAGVVSHIVWPPSRWRRVTHQLTPEQEERTKQQTPPSDRHSHTNSVEPD